MSLSMQQALSIGTAFRTQGLLVSTAEEVEQFDKARIKNLSAADRKICYQALSKLERAQLSDFDRENSNTEQLDPDRVEWISETIINGPAPAEAKKTGWYAKPFVWIAHKTHSFFLWFKNTFMGRVSTDKLWNKVEAYLNDVRVAETRVKALNDQNGEIQKAANATNEKAEKQKEFLEAEFKPLLGATEVIIQINTDDACFQVLRRNLNNTWIVGNHNVDVVRKLSFREVIIAAIESANENVQEVLQSLYDLATNEESTEKSLRDEFDTVSRNIESAINKEIDQGNTLHEELKAVHKQQTELENEATLLKSKYQIAL